MSDPRSPLWNKSSTNLAVLPSQNAQEFRFPRGMKFRPSNEQLVGHYLYKKTYREQGPYDSKVISDCDLYGEEEPWQIYDRLVGGHPGDKGLFFFTNLKKKRSRFERKIGNGTWHGENGAETFHVKNGDELITCMKKRFVYKKPGSRQDGGWMMYEFSAGFSNDRVICQLIKNEKTSALNPENLGRKRKVVANQVQEPDCVATQEQEPEPDCVIVHQEQKPAKQTRKMLPEYIDPDPDPDRGEAIVQRKVVTQEPEPDCVIIHDLEQKPAKRVRRILAEYVDPDLDRGEVIVQRTDFGQVQESELSRFLQHMIVNGDVLDYHCTSNLPEYGFNASAPAVSQLEEYFPKETAGGDPRSSGMEKLVRVENLKSYTGGVYSSQAMIRADEFPVHYYDFSV